ncbi:D-2-hydroxyacid dehydrogenase [Microbacterium sp. YY-01]|uniref:D-2-hydroxyacid dehydrogenase n=1 Tax=Microbacterium sp. YY-01 TaxID=3421634 RepID=UPI003D16624C
MSTQRLRVVVAAPFHAENAAVITDKEPRIELVYEPELLPPMRHPADFSGDPSYQRTAEQQRRYCELLDSADALYGIPDVNPLELARTVRANPRLQWVHTMAAGGGGQVKAANLSDEELARVTFTTSAGVHGEPLAEFALFGVLAGAKDLHRLLHQQQQKNWSDRWAMRQITDMTILVLGVGGIGRSVATKASALGARVVGYSRRTEVPDGFDAVVGPAELKKAVAAADAIVTTLPGTAHTENLINADLLEHARENVIIVNVGRGTVINEPELTAFLQQHPAAFAALDVFAHEPLSADSPLWAMSNVLIAPHTAALTTSEEKRIAELFASNATSLLNGEPLRNVVDTVEFY